jgi:hypothetical protein
MTVGSLVVLVHALVAIGMVAGLVGRWVVLAAAERATDLGAVRTLTAVAAPFERLVIFGSLATLVLGILAAIAQDRPFLGPLQGEPVDWLFVSVVLFLSLLPLVPLVFVPKGRVFDAALADAQREGRLTPALEAAFRDPVTRAARIVELAIVTLILALMIAKPF